MKTFNDLKVGDTIYLLAKLYLVGNIYNASILFEKTQLISLNESQKNIQLSTKNKYGSDFHVTIPITVKNLGFINIGSPNLPYFVILNAEDIYEVFKCL